jgi:hypothetical protein
MDVLDTSDDASGSKAVPRVRADRVLLCMKNSYSRPRESVTSKLNIMPLSWCSAMWQ